MKGIPPSGADLFMHGPLFEAEIHADELSFLSTKNDQSPGSCISVKLLVDTGANISGIDHRVVNHLQLRAYDTQTKVNGVGGQHMLQRYRCILFMDIFGHKGLPLDILAGDYTHSPYDGVIGRDVLRYCRFVFDGPSNRFHLEAIDF